MRALRTFQADLEEWDTFLKNSKEVNTDGSKRLRLFIKRENRKHELKNAKK